MSSAVGALIDAAVLDQPLAERMLAEHPELRNGTWLWGESPLHFLAVENYLDAVRFLGARGFDVNAVDNYGDTALTSVVRLNNVAAVKLLLELGANPNGGDPNHETPLCTAVARQHYEVAEILVEAGAKGGHETFDQVSIHVALFSLKDPAAKARMIETLRRLGCDPMPEAE